jgi:hypothetical protein
MASTFTAITQYDDGWWIGWIEEIPGINCQEPTREELLESLKVTLREALEPGRFAKIWPFLLPSSAFFEETPLP